MTQQTCDYCGKREVFFDTYLFGIGICLPCLRTFRAIEKDERKRKLFYVVAEEVTQHPRNYHQLKGQQRAKFLKQRQTPQDSLDVLSQIGDQLIAVRKRNDKIEYDVAKKKQDEEKAKKVKAKKVVKEQVVQSNKKTKADFTYGKITVGALYVNGNKKRLVIGVDKKSLSHHPSHAKETIYWCNKNEEEIHKCRAKSFADWFKR